MSSPVGKELSPQEIRVAILIAKGVKPKQIAEQLEISVKTVNTFRGRILDKLDVDSNVAIAFWAKERGLI
jgi:DNA-binding NarL/FixJ family response regulator